MEWILIVITGLLAGAIGVWLLVQKVWFKRERIQDPPKGMTDCLPGIPRVTPSPHSRDDFDLIGAAGSLHQFLSLYHAKHGPIFQFRWSNGPVVSVASPEGFRELRRLYDRPPELFKLFEPLIGEGSIQFANGEIAKRRRKAYNHCFTASTIRRHYLPHFQSQIHSPHIRAFLNSEEPFCLHTLCMRLSLGAVIDTLFMGQLTGDQSQRFSEAYELVWNTLEARLTGILHTEENQFEQHLDWVKETIAELVQRCRSSGLGSTSSCGDSSDSSSAFSQEALAPFLTTVVGTDILSERERSDELITMIVGGSHTTGNLLFWLIYYLLLGPAERVARVEAELGDFHPDQSAIPVFTKACLDETMRMSVLAPWAARFSDKEEVVLGKSIPAHVPIIMALGVELHDPSVWGADWDQFRPERFLDGNKPAGYAFSPFGFAGGRVCPGHTFALTEATILLSNILKDYSLSLHSTTPVSIRHGLVTSPADPFLIHSLPR